MTVRVVVVDDQELVRAGFVALLASDPGLTVVGEAGQGEEALRLVARERPDVVLMDVRMPILDGVEATRRILADPVTHHVRVIILTTFGIDEYVFGALRAGAAGFLLKDTPPAELLRAVHVAAEGDALLSPSVTRMLIDELGRVPPRRRGPSIAAELTAREEEVLGLVACGLSNAEIAARLHLGLATVKSHVSSLLDKVGAATRTHLVIHAYEAGIVVPGSSTNLPS